MSRWIVTAAWLIAVWVALWGDLTWANLSSGLLVALLAIRLTPQHHPRISLGFRAGPAIVLLFYFAWQLVKASAIVAWEVLTPADRTQLGVVEVPLTSNSDGIITIVANMVSLTPGTITLEASASPPSLLVHALHVRDPESVARGVAKLEELTISAFPAHTGRPGKGVVASEGRS